VIGETQVGVMARLPRFEDFAGRWRLERKITDRRAGTSGRFEGLATMRAREGALDYLEEGELSFAGKAPLAASRRYVWRRAENGAVDVYFEDGRFFLSFPLDRLMPDATHVCSPDLYHVTFDFTDWPEWRAKWRVVGPRKDYCLSATYRREG